MLQLILHTNSIRSSDVTAMLTRTDIVAHAVSAVQTIQLPYIKKQSFEVQTVGLSLCIKSLRSRTGRATAE